MAVKPFLLFILEVKIPSQSKNKLKMLKEMFPNLAD